MLFLYKLFFIYEKTNLKETLEELAKIKFPYETIETSGDKFTRDLRNGTIDMLRNAYILGACDILKAYTKE